MCLSTVEQQALKYLGCSTVPDGELLSQLRQGVAAVESHAVPRFVAQIYPLTHAPLTIPGVCELDYPALRALFARCESVCVIGATLGREMERYTTYLSKIDMAKLVVVDAVASAYLEDACDKYEETLGLGERTFRFCPGYSGVDLSLNTTLCRALQMDKHIGLTVQPSHLLLPQKSMIGLIGLGDEGQAKTCGDCPKLHHCAYRAKEERCYKIN